MDKYKEAELWGYAMRLKRYCKSRKDCCSGCIFDDETQEDKFFACKLNKYIPEDWEIEE